MLPFLQALMCSIRNVSESYYNFSPQNVSPVRGGGKALPFGSLPVSHMRRDYLSLISSLPDTDSPALFGLPANIEQSLQRTISSKV